MPTDLSRPPAVRPPGDARPAPDPAFAARPRLVALVDVLRDADRRPRPDAELFFFNPARQAELEAARPRPSVTPDDLSQRVAAVRPALAASAEVRRVGRAVPGLVAAANGRAADHPAARELADLLAVVDDEVVLVIHPAARTGVRVAVTGVFDVRQLHESLADALPGPRPAAVRARWGLYAASALRADGTLPTGLGGSDHWLWGDGRANAIPRVNGERVVLLGDPPFADEWAAEPRLPDVTAEVRVTAVLTRAEVVGHLEAWTGRPLAVTEEREMARAA